MNGLNKGFLRKVIKMMCQTPGKHVGWYTTGLKGAAALRAEINQVQSYEELEQLLGNKLTL